MEFARYMTEYKGKMPEAIHRYLESIDFKDKYTCLPEETTSFKGKDLGTGEGRHHDGLLVSKNYLIGIEAKVSESFDYSLQKKIAIAENVMLASNQKKINRGKRKLSRMLIRAKINQKYKKIKY